MSTSTIFLFLLLVAVSLTAVGTLLVSVWEEFHEAAHKPQWAKSDSRTPMSGRERYPGIL